MWQYSYHVFVYWGSIFSLNKRGIDKIILTGMSAKLCTESYIRESLKQDIEVVVIKDASAAACAPEGDGIQAALTNYHYMANSDCTITEAMNEIERTAKN
jgi:nicotinamidase-related amidase